MRAGSMKVALRGGLWLLFHENSRRFQRIHGTDHPVYHPPPVILAVNDILVSRIRHGCEGGPNHSPNSGCSGFLS